MRTLADEPDVLRAVAREYLRRGMEPPPECRPVLEHEEEDPMDAEQPPATCSTPGCSRPAKTKGLCSSCYARARRAAAKRPATAKPVKAPERHPDGSALASDLLTLAEAREAMQKVVGVLVDFGWERSKAEAVVNAVVHGRRE